MVTLLDFDGTWVNPAAVLYDGGELRRADSAGFAVAGIVRGVEDEFAVTVDASDQVTVGMGVAAIPGNAAAGTGIYRTGSPAATAATPLTARDVTNGRVDLVVLRQLDTDVVASHGAYTSRLEVITGTPSAAPSAPALPDMAVELARLTVPVSGGGAVTVDTSRRVYACAPGGTLFVGSSSVLPTTALYLQRAVALDDGTEYVFDGADWQVTNAAISIYNSGNEVRFAAGNAVFPFDTIVEQAGGASMTGSTTINLPPGKYAFDVGITSDGSTTWPWWVNVEVGGVVVAQGYGELAGPGLRSVNIGKRVTVNAGQSVQIRVSNHGSAEGSIVTQGGRATSYFTATQVA